MKTLKLYTTLIVLGIVLLGLVSCVDDEGSYENLPVNEVTVSGLEDEYNVIAGVTELVIEPEIEGSLKGTDDSNYEYTWYVCYAEIGAEHEHTVLSNEKDLDIVLTLPPRSYALYLSIRDKESGLEWLFDTDLYVQTMLTRGFYVFGDKEYGTVGMDFLSMPSGSDSIIIKDIFINSHGLHGAEELMFSGASYSADGQTLWAVTSDGTYKITNNISGENASSVFDVDETYSPDNMFFPQFDVKRPIKIIDMAPKQSQNGRAPSSTNRVYVTEDGVYGCSPMSGEAYGNPFNRYSNTSSELFLPYKTAFFRRSYMSGVMVYDLDNERFTTSSSSMMMSVTNCRVLKDSPDDPFPWNQTNRTIVYGDNCVDDNCYVVMKDTENTNLYYVYKFSVTSVSSPSKDVGYTIDISRAPGFDVASYYAFFTDQPYILYTVGSQLYGLNYSLPNSQAVMLHDFGSEITYMTFDWISRSMETDIAICTYDETNKGTIYKYEINNDPNVIEIRPIENCEWKTDLKVKKLEFRNSSF